MSKQLYRSVANQSRASKIQIEVREIAQPVSQNIKSELSVDADGGDVSHE